MPRKARKSTPEEEIKFETKDYTEAVSHNRWKIERKFGDEIMEAVKFLDLKLKLDKLSRESGSSFFVSLLLQLRREDVYGSLEKELKKIADRFSHKIFRWKVCDFMLKNQEQKVLDFKQEFYDHQKPSDKNKPTWEDYWEEMKQMGMWPNYWMEKAAALKLGIDINIVEITGMKKNPYVTRYIGAYGNSDKQQKCLILGLKTDLHYQSLLPKEETTDDDAEKKTDSEDEQMELEKECPVCEITFTHLLKHLAVNKTCKGKVDKTFVEVLQAKAELKRQWENKFKKAKSRKRKQALESHEERENRLALKSYYMAKMRDKRRKEDPEGMKRKAREQKEISRDR